MKIRAAVCRAFGAPLSIEEVTLADPGPGEVRVRLAACAICHSDLSYIDGAWGGSLPAVFGHEAAGVVEEIGAGVVGIAPGAHVVVALIRSCGGCFYCARGDQILCETVFPLDQRSPIRGGAGESIGHGLRTGGFAEAVVVHRSQVVEIPPQVPLDRACLLACGVITGVGAVTNTARVPAGSAVVVVGAGGVGLNAVQGAALAGARRIIAIDVAEAKLQAARRFGATDLLAAGADTAARVQALTEGRGADYVFVAAGAKGAIEGAFGLIRKGGTVVIVGMPASGVETAFDPGSFAGWSQRVLGAKMGSARLAIDIPALVDLYRQGRLKLDELVSGRYPLARINEALDDARAGGALRNVILL